MTSLFQCILILAVAFTSNTVVTSIGSYDLQAMKIKINIVKSLLRRESCPIGSGVNSRRKRSLTLPDSLQYEVESQLYNQLMDILAKCRKAKLTTESTTRQTTPRGTLHQS